MRIIVQRTLIALLVLLGGCAPQGPLYGGVAGTLPPLPPGAARLYFYRWLEPYETLAPAVVYLNNRPVGVSQPGAVLYRDVAPGRYTIVVESSGIYPDQFETVALAAGRTAYARIESLRSWSACDAHQQGCFDTLVVRIIDPAVAQGEIPGLRFIQG